MIVLIQSIIICTDAFATINKSIHKSTPCVHRSPSSHTSTSYNINNLNIMHNGLKKSMMATISDEDVSASDDDKRNTRLSNTYRLLGILSSLAWLATSYVALSYHPDPKFADCTLRHNLLTMGQAFAFPLPVFWATFAALRNSTRDGRTITSSKMSQRLNMGIAIASFWLAASLTFPSSFAFGYDLYTTKHKVITSIIHSCTGIFALVQSLRSTTSIGQITRRFIDALWMNNRSTTFNQKNSAVYATASLGLLYFAIQPVVSPYPLATIPTILGKRLSRPASAFTLLGAVIAYSLREKSVDDDERRLVENVLRKGIGLGSAAHLALIFLKVIGVDGGGLIFKGRGLWEVYPAMIAVPFAASCSFAVYALLCFAVWTDDE